MPNIKLIIEYDGSKFHGWQMQPKIRNIQGELDKVIRTVLNCDISNITASGRTDAGVHALAQVVNFRVDRDVDIHRLKHSISSIMKGELSVVDAQIVDDRFNSCRDAICKQYVYTILYRAAPAVLDYGRVWHIAADLDLERMKKEAACLVGEHDFQSLRASGCSARTSIKEIFESELTLDGFYLRYRVVGSGFLKQMVRNIVGTLVAFGRDRLEVADMQELLSLRDRKKAGTTAPAHGLCLEWVRYATAPKIMPSLS